MFDALIPAEWSASIAQMEPLLFWTITFVALAVAAACCYLTFHFLHRAWLLERTPASKARSAVQGYVELDGVGELLPGELSIAPLTGTRCLWFRYKVERREEESTPGAGIWQTLRKGTSTQHFRLMDETGECLVDPAGAEVIPSVRDEWYGDTEEWQQGPAPKHGGSHFATSRYRYTEERIHPADTLHAIGWFVTDELQQTERAPRRLMSKPRDGSPYILSALPHKQLLRRYRNYFFAALLFFVLSGVVAGWLWSIYVTMR